jgi:hypothetical protein
VKWVASAIVVLVALFATAAAHAKPSKVVKFSTAPGLCGVNRLSEGGMGCFANAQARSWSGVGVRCRHGNGLRRHNRDGHGFILHRMSYRQF